MARSSVVTCDWCEEQTTVQDEEVVGEHGWIEVAVWNEDEPVFLEFCGPECVISYFS